MKSLLSDCKLLAKLSRDTFQSRKAEDIEPFNRKIEDACKQAVRTEFVIA